MTISKSDYMLYLRHPAWLWLKKHDKAKLPPVDAATQALFDAGHAFEYYAESLFPGGAKIGFNNYQEYLSLPARTKEALDEGAATIFQGRFEHEGFTFICDIVQVVGESTVDLYEIKSSTSVKTEHIYDLAFQATILEACGYRVRDIYVIHVNNQYVRHGEVEADQFCETTDITEQVKAKSASTKEAMQRASATAEAEDMPDPSPRFCKLGGLKDWLDIYAGLVEVADGSIYGLASPGMQRLGELEDLGIAALGDIPDTIHLTDKQRLQVLAAKRGEAIIEAGPIRAFLDTLTFPLYFLDYETLSSLVPSFDGLRPYQQLPFQYSLHIMDEPGAELRHREYLHRDNTNPARPLTEQLLEDIGDTGSVIVWYEGFEKGRNSELGELLPEYADELAAINGRVVDLMLPFSSGWYAHGDFKGSASIKNVLPVLVPELSYGELDIQDGAAAQRLWMQTILDGKHADEKDKILDDLIEYCRLDTLAMVKIYEHLHTLIPKDGPREDG